MDYEVADNTMDYEAADNARSLAFALIGFVLSIIHFAYPTLWVMFFKDKRIKGSMEDDDSPAYFLLILLKCGLWVVYGLTMDGPYDVVHSFLITICNMVGVIASIATLYILFLSRELSDQNVKIGFIVLAEIVLFLIIMPTLGSTVAHTQKERSIIVGVLATLADIVTQYKLFNVMRVVIKTGRMDHMSFILSLTSMLGGISWLIFALFPLIDYWLFVTNVVASLSGAAQLILYLVYREPTKRALIEERKPQEKQAMDEMAK